MRIFTFIIFVICNWSASFTPAQANVPTITQGERSNYVASIAHLIDNSDNVDYLDIKLTIDKLIDPKVDIRKTRGEVMEMVIDIEKMIAPNASEWDKVQALRKYIYDDGDWNNHRSFSYDLNDPQGNSRTSRLLHNYLETRKGNCVSMPILHAILGQKIGLDMTISTAPLHMFVRYKNEAGETLNLEATSGGHPARDAWYQKNLPMLPKAITNGMFMKDLSTSEAIAVIGHDLSNYLTREGPYDEAIKVSEKLIEEFPKYAPLYLSRGSAFQKLIETEFRAKYPNQNDVPEEKRQKLQYLLQQNLVSFNIAEQLGWKHPDELAKELE